MAGASLFLKPKDEVIVPQFSFLMYRIYAKIAGANVKFAGNSTFFRVGAVTEENTLYGSVGTNEIIDKITTAGFDLDKQAIRLPEGPIKDLGDFEIDIELHPEVIAKISIKVSPEE